MRITARFALACFAALTLSIAGPVVHADGPPVTRLTKSYHSKFFLRYSPSGSHIVYSRHYANRRAANQVLVGLHLVAADGSDDRRLLAEFDRDVQIQEHPSWSPDGKRLALSGGGNDTGNSSKDTFICDIDGDGKATALRKLVPGAGVQIGEEPCWSPDGQRIVAVSTIEQLFVVGADGKGRVQILQVDGSYCHQPDWSPDGEWIAFASDRDGNVEIYKVRPDGSELTRLSRAPGVDAHPRWSPDGRWLSFTSNRAGNYDIWTMRADGSDAQQLTQHVATDDHAAWSPDGKSLSFVSMRDGGFDIYRLSVPATFAVADHPDARPTTSAPAAAAPNDLVLHYSFDDEPPDARVVRDRAGRHPLELAGAKLVMQPSKKVGALAFDGQNSTASAGNAEDLRIGGAMTLSLWVQLPSVSGNGYVVSKHGWNIYVGADAIPRFETRNAADNAWDTLPAKQPLPLQTWSFIAVVFDPAAKSKRIYVNGELSAESHRDDGAIAGVAGYPLEFGHYVVSKTQFLQGQIDEVRLHRRALTAAAIRQEFERSAK